MRITNQQKLQARAAVSDSGLALNQFSLAETETQLTFQFRSFDFHFSISKAGRDVYALEYNTVAHLGNRAFRKNWADTMTILRSWAKRIAADQAAAPKDEPSPSFGVADAFQGAPHVSKRFSKIFAQAEKAEELGLDEVCGMGYRKAVEVLIKEHLIRTKAATKEEILTLELGQCIEHYISSDELKLLATRSAWLGNDFSHYLRIWKERSIQDLKSFIHITVRWMGIHRDLKRVRKLMPTGRRRTKTKRGTSAAPELVDTVP